MSSSKGFTSKLFDRMFDDRGTKEDVNDNQPMYEKVIFACKEVIIKGEVHGLERSYRYESYSLHSSVIYNSL